MNIINIPISVLYKIREYLIEEFIIYLKDGYLVKNDINNYKIKKLPVKKFTNIIYNGYHYKITTNNLINYKLINNEWEKTSSNTDNYYKVKNYIYINNFKIKFPYNNSYFLGFYNNNKLFLQITKKSNYNNLIITNNDNIINKYNNLFFPYSIIKYLTTINNLNILIVDSIKEFKLNIGLDYKLDYKLLLLTFENNIYFYKIIKEIDYNDKIFINNNKIIIINKNINIYQIKNLNLELEYKIDINIKYEKVFLSNNYIYLIKEGYIYALNLMNKDKQNLIKINNKSMKFIINVYNNKKIYFDKLIDFIIKKKEQKYLDGIKNLKYK